MITFFKQLDDRITGALIYPTPRHVVFKAPKQGYIKANRKRFPKPAGWTPAKAETMQMPERNYIVANRKRFPKPAGWTPEQVVPVAETVPLNEFIRVGRKKMRRREV